MSEYLIRIAALIPMYVILIAAFNFSVGWGGIVNLGHVGLFAIGAYTAVLLSMNGVAFPLALLGGATAAAIGGLVIAVITRRIRGDYLALVTLGFSFIVYSLILNTKEPLGASFGLSVPRPEIFGISLLSNLDYLGFAVLLAVALIYLLYRITRSPLGLAMEAIRDDEQLARSLGKRVEKLRAMNLMIAGAYAGVAGGLFAHYLNYIHPSVFYLNELIAELAMLLLGGLGSIAGSVIGAIVILLLPEALRFIAISPELVGPLRMILYALVLLGIAFLRPQGICGRVRL
ncbi:MAG TPA: branched-chain amino acid ABC transporter permease [Candidatus Bilamarchaeaceae archaeon]|nr:branched-chain amino acid ABC transporter permease [Candidatus Bilamarchaeaceae archaeon]